MLHPRNEMTCTKSTLTIHGRYIANTYTYMLYNILYICNNTHTTNHVRYDTQHDQSVIWMGGYYIRWANLCRSSTYIQNTIDSADDDEYCSGALYRSVRNAMRFIWNECASAGRRDDGSPASRSLSAQLIQS